MAFQMLTLSSRIRAIGPLSRCRSGDCHTSDIGVCSKFTNIFGVANRQVYPLVRSGQSSANSSPAKCKDILKPGGIHFANRVEKFSTTTAAAKSFESFQGQNKASTSGGKYGSLYRIALAALGVTTAVVSLHASAHLAMATGSERLNLDSAKGDWNEVKDALLHMSQEERRKHYRTTYLSLDEVPVWTAKSLVDTGGDSVKGTKFKRNEALDKKISLFSGDITKLEIDGIVNAAVTQQHSEQQLHCTTGDGLALLQHYGLGLVQQYHRWTGSCSAVPQMDWVLFSSTTDGLGLVQQYHRWTGSCSAVPQMDWILFRSTTDGLGLGQQYHR
uniref:Uncharacterized protein n=1 Tax=Hucho hucho TaxID=62062 RepID=A0A4W5RMZ7_9TELE